MDDIMGRTHKVEKRWEKLEWKWKYRTKGNSELLYQNHISAEPLICYCKDPALSSQPCLVLIRKSYVTKHMKAFVHEKFCFLY